MKQIIFRNPEVDTEETVYINRLNFNREKFIVCVIRKHIYLLVKNGDDFVWVSLTSPSVAGGNFDTIEEAINESYHDGKHYLFKDLIALGEWLVKHKKEEKEESEI